MVSEVVLWSTGSKLLDGWGCKENYVHTFCPTIYQFEVYEKNLLILVPNLFLKRVGYLLYTKRKKIEISFYANYFCIFYKALVRIWPIKTFHISFKKLR